LKNPELNNNPKMIQAKVDEMRNVGQKIKKVRKLFNSNLWKSLNDTKVGISIAYNICKIIFGIKVIFFKNGLPTYDETNYYSQMTKQEKK
jgi:hypothetical protein